MIAIDLSKPQALDADPGATQQIHSTGNLDLPADALIFFIFEKAKETIFGFSQGTARVL